MGSVERLLERDGFIFGIVAPWFEGKSYGCDIGISPLRQECLFNYNKVEEMLYNCKAIGFNCVRLWLFEIMEGILFDENGYALGVEQNMWKNIHTIYEIAESIDMDLVITFQPHISFSMKFPDPYLRYTRILHSPEHIKSFTDNVIAPLAKYFCGKEHIVMLDVYAEPEGDTQGEYGNRYQPYGVTLEQMQYYIKKVTATLKEYAPDIPVTACSGWQWYNTLRAGLYNNLGLDYIGVDIYIDSGELEPVDTLKCTKPVWLAEFGAETKYNWDDDFLAENACAFYKSAIHNNYFGAFFWMYGYPDCANGEALMLVSDNGDVRPAADKIKVLVTDYINQFRYGKSMPDVPSFLYFRDCMKIKWFGARQAVRYRLERSVDRCKWAVIALIDVDLDSNNRIAYCDDSAESGLEYYYRVAAIFENHQEVYSKMSCCCKL